MKKTKIICSIGPASSSPSVMSQMVEAGMNVARINFSHATMEERETVVSSVKEVREMTGKNVAILYDTKGPEFRSGMLEGDEAVLVAGETLRLVKETIVGNKDKFSVNFPNALNSVSVGTTILLENGLMELVVESIEEDGVTCDIISGGVLGNKKSMSVPGVKLDIPFISEIDKEDILYAANHEGDYLALSFVSSADDVYEVRELLKENNCEGIKLISKIESQTGVDNLEEIAEVSDGIMVARGDLGVEVPMAKLPFIQKEMIDMCRKHNIIGVVATEMLESMKKNIRPTRAEVADISKAVMDGTDAVMLSGETTMGSYPVETVSFMAEIARTAEEYFEFNGYEELVVSDNVLATLAESASFISEHADLVVVNAMNVEAAKLISNFKPETMVIAVVNSEDAKNKLVLNYAVYSEVKNEFTLDIAKEVALKYVESGKKVVIFDNNNIVLETV